MERQIKIIVEKHSDGYVAYPLGLRGVVVGEGDSYESALADVRSAILFHLETFGADRAEAMRPRCWKPLSRRQPYRSDAQVSSRRAKGTRDRYPWMHWALSSVREG